MPIEIKSYLCEYCNNTFDSFNKAIVHERFNHLCGKCDSAYSVMGELNCKYNFNCGSTNQKFKPMK